jgi:hypothetical protein
VGDEGCGEYAGEAEGGAMTTTEERSGEDWWVWGVMIGEGKEMANLRPHLE